ncbi:ABC transporter permease [Phaeovulum sp. NW3]|uniref:ABC transporter permease n=1 Tax=Phaeovulum sp. NW3 TaxID=2934933 RepID=UPI002021BEE6|nr:ABC transporter permease [Phaeovulum sp. NW3]MCL7465431.1 ABC transporter permease [Phaeovulum sp. NW3]
MFKARRSNSTLGSGFALLELIYHATVRSVRKTHGNAVIGLLLNMLQTVMLVLVFYFMLDILGMRGVAIRGDFLLYIMSGIFLYMTHTKTLTAVTMAEGSTSPMMKHGPMTTAVSIASAALGALYLQILSMVVVLYIYHAGFNPIEIENPIAAMGMVLLAWFSGVAMGLVFMALKPWAPDVVQVIQLIYIRANMFASGKMFVANMLPAFMLGMFDWNPLFHMIDQARGFTFINYNPHFSSVSYPLYVGLAFMVIGLMGEFYTRQYNSISWNAKR